MRLRRFISKRLLLVVFSLLAIGAIKIVVFYAIVNARGEKAWQGALERLREHGEDFTVEELVVSGESAASNFFGTPSLDGIARPLDGSPESALAARRRTRLERALPKARKPERLPPNPLLVDSADEAATYARWLDHLEASGALESVPESRPEPPHIRLSDWIESTHRDLFEELASASTRPVAVITPNRSDRATDAGQLSAQAELPHVGAVIALARLQALGVAVGEKCGHEESV